MTALDDALEKAGAAAFVAVGSSADADIRYLTQFRVTDPIVYIKKPGEPGIVVVSRMEYERANRESAARAISRHETGFFEFLKEDPDHPVRATARMIAALTEGSILVPPHFPYALGKELESFHPVSVERDAISSMRSVKSAKEVDSVRQVQKATERAMKIAVTMIRRSRVKGESLEYRDRPLTSEWLKVTIQKEAIQFGCIARDTIVSCGSDTAVPHLTGSGPLRPDEPIVIDIFPQNEESGYFADMTRTVVKGEPSREITEMYRAVRDAQNHAISRVKPGISGADLHQEIVDLFKAQGYASDGEGFVHNLGHGVGLEVHEAPVVGSGGRTALQAGNVITIEPGLYYPSRGGIRLEDMGLVTEQGFNRFTQFEETLIL